MSKAHESPILLVKVDEEYAVILEQSIVLRYKTLAKGFIAYATAFSTFFSSDKNRTESFDRNAKPYILIL